MADFDPTDPLGCDVMITDDLDANHRLISGVVLLATDLYRRIITPRGSLIDDEDYGIDIRAMLHKAMTPAEEATIPSRVRAECLKDPRVETVNVVLTREGSPLPNRWRVQIYGTSIGDEAFDLVVGVGDLDVQLLEAA